MDFDTKVYLFIVRYIKQSLTEFKVCGSVHLQPLK